MTELSEFDAELAPENRGRHRAQNPNTPKEDEQSFIADEIERVAANRKGPIKKFVVSRADIEKRKRWRRWQKVGLVVVVTVILTAALFTFSL